MHVKYVSLMRSEVYLSQSDVDPGQLVKAYTGLLSYPRAWWYVLRHPNG
jgi:hypothetical protein